MSMTAKCIACGHSWSAHPAPSPAHPTILECPYCLNQAALTSRQLTLTYVELPGEEQERWMR